QKLEHHQKEVGYGKIIAMMQFGTLPHDLTKRNMELFAKKVMPKIRHIGANSAPVVVEAAQEMLIKPKPAAPGDSRSSAVSSEFSSHRRTEMFSRRHLLRSAAATS